MPNFKAFSIPAPVGGLNDRDSLADMAPQDAVVMTNWWPYPSYVGIRKGYEEWAIGITDGSEEDTPATPDTIVEYNAPNGTPQLFAAVPDLIYDATTSSPNLVFGTYGSDIGSKWQDVHITTPGGSFMYLLNGQSEAVLYDGSTWQQINSGTTPDITGVDTDTLIHGCLFKNRIFFVAVGSLTLYYLPPLFVGGTVAELDLGSVFRFGGYIMAVYPWTIDAGDGMDDHLVVISSEGEVAVYKGTDPSDANAWALVGVFVLGRPIGRRCGIKYGGDLAINTYEGVYPLGKGLLTATIDRRIALTDKIQNVVSADAERFGTNYGWELCLFPDANMMILNVAGNSKRFQYAQNTITGAWAKFDGMNALCWRNASTGLYFGALGGVYKAWVGNFDTIVVNGGNASIVADVLPAFGYFGSKALNKYFTMVRPYIQTNGSPSILYGLNTDFVSKAPTGVLSYSPPTGMVWGSMTWGSMTWGGGNRSLASWKTVGAVANSAAIRLKIQGNGAEVKFISNDYGVQTSVSVL